MPSGISAQGPSSAHSPAALRRSVVLLVIVSLALFLVNIGSLPLVDPDESRCGLIVQEMLRTGDWLMPRLEGNVYYDKPAPFFWLAAIAQRLSGNIEFGGRIVAALAAVGAVLATWSLARRQCGPLAGLMAGLILATSGLFLFMGRFYRMDMPFAAFMWAAVWWFWRYEPAAPAGQGGPAGQPSPAGRGARWIGFYAFCAAATLMKGPAGAAFPVMVVAVYMLLQRRPRRLLEFVHPLGIVIFLLIAAPWYVAVQWRYPEYAYKFFLVENVERAVGVSHRSHMPLPLFVLLPIAAIAPWTIYLPGAIVRTIRRDCPCAPAAVRLLLWSAVLSPLAAFAFSSRLANYVVPSMPPLAVLVALPLAHWASGRQADRLYRLGGWIAAVAIPVMVGALAGVELLYLRNFDAWSVAAAAGALGCGAAMSLALRSDRRLRFLAAAIAGVLVLFALLIAHDFPVGFAARSNRQFGRLAARRVAPDAQLCYWSDDRPSFPLYAGRDRATRFNEHAPEDLKRLAALMKSAQPVCCLVSSRQHLAMLQAAAPGRVRLLDRDKRGHFLVANPPALAATRPASTPPAASAP